MTGRFLAQAAVWVAADLVGGGGPGTQALSWSWVWGLQLNPEMPKGLHLLLLPSFLDAPSVLTPHSTPVTPGS